MLLDKRHDLCIVTKVLSTETNFAQKDISSYDKLIEFADRIMFPSHGLILQGKLNHGESIIKNIADHEELLHHFYRFHNRGINVRASSDMRAMNYPTRMKVIAKAAEKHARKLQQHCPECGIPGFDVTDARTGLPCSAWGTPTRSALALIHECVKCGFRKEENYPDKKQTEDPMYGDRCNP